MESLIKTQDLDLDKLIEVSKLVGYADRHTGVTYCKNCVEKEEKDELIEVFKHECTEEDVCDLCMSLLIDI